MRNQNVKYEEIELYIMIENIDILKMEWYDYKHIKGSFSRKAILYFFYKRIELVNNGVKRDYFWRHFLFSKSKF